jgi:hypothetical protein
MMRKTLLPILPALIAGALLAIPGTAGAADGVTHDCGTADCTGTTWVSQPTVTFSWPATATDPSPDCHDNGQPFSPPEGDDTLTCSVLLDDGVTQASDSVHILVDNTPPTATGSPSVPANPFGWWNATPLTINFAWSDPAPAPGVAVSGVDQANCEDSVPYTGGDTDTLGTLVAAGCSDAAGNRATARGVPVLFDNTPPHDVHGTPSRLPDANGWYSHDVTLQFDGQDDESGIDSCDSITYSGPDSATAGVTGGCQDKAGNPTNVTETIKYDGTKPVVNGATADRAPDHDGWYNHPVTFAFHGTDPTSGMAGCSTVAYSGPDDGTAQVMGHCTDGAGNATFKTAQFPYDSTPPARSKLFAVPANKSVGLSWAPPSDGESFVVRRTPAIGPQVATVVYRGSKHDYLDAGLKNGAKYNYTVTTVDPAGNTSDAVISSVPDGSTLRPFIDSEVTQAPQLTWKKVRHATYYNVQLFKGRKKVLSTWPKTAKLQLKKSWKYNGRKYKMSSGLYRWYVWPGLGRVASHRYGAMVGSSTFRVK